MKLEAAVIQGDGVGPEMMEEAVRVLQAVCLPVRPSFKAVSCFSLLSGH